MWYRDYNTVFYYLPYTTDPSSPSHDNTARKPSNKIAAFDIVGTLVQSASGSQYFSNAADWIWLYTTIPEYLKKLYAEEWTIVIFTNQLGNTAVMEAILVEMVRELGFEPLVWVSTTRDIGAKPNITMWYSFLRVTGVVPEKCSFYVGDKGRPPVLLANIKEECVIPLANQAYLATIHQR